MENNILNILRKELREMFRDKKSISMMLIIPFMIPLLILGMSALFDTTVNKPLTDYNKIGFAYELSEAEKSLAKEMQIEVISGSSDEIKKMYQNEQVDVYITKEGNNYIINGYDDENTMYAKELARSYLNYYKTYRQQEYLKNANINPLEVVDVVMIDDNITPSENYFASYITTYAFLFIIMAITVSATYPATDATAGEKERGTLETLLTFPIKSKDIIIGKFLSVSLSSIITGLLSLILMVISLSIAGNIFDIYKEVELMLPWGNLIFLLLVIVAYSFLISGLCIAIASKSKTFKEAQSALTPLTFISFFPGMIAFMSDISTTPLLSLIPFLNFSLIYTDITNGIYNYLNIFLMILSTVLVISIVLIIIIKQYKSEKVLFNN